MNNLDIGVELYERIKADFERRTVDLSRSAGMSGVSVYAQDVGRILAECIRDNLDQNELPDGRMYYNIAQKILDPALRMSCGMVNDAAVEEQLLLDELAGVRIKPMPAEFDEERVEKAVSAASEEDIPWERTVRRMTSPAENITVSTADRFMEKNAEIRSKAGFDTFIERSGGSNCCPWCAGLVGKYSYPDGTPKDVFGRHDNCTCTVTFGTKGGARQDVWSKKIWNAEQDD